MAEVMVKVSFLYPDRSEDAAVKSSGRQRRNNRTGRTKEKKQPEIMTMHVSLFFHSAEGGAEDVNEFDCFLDSFIHLFWKPRNKLHCIQTVRSPCILLDLQTDYRFWFRTSPADFSDPADQQGDHAVLQRFCQQMERKVISRPDSSGISQQEPDKGPGVKAGSGLRFRPAKKVFRLFIV